MQLLNFMYGRCVAIDAMAMIKIDDSTRDELRKYKAEHGDTYDGAVNRLLVASAWYDE